MSWNVKCGLFVNTRFLTSKKILSPTHDGCLIQKIMHIRNNWIHFLHVKVTHQTPFDFSDLVNGPETHKTWNLLQFCSKLTYLNRKISYCRKWWFRKMSVKHHVKNRQNLFESGDACHDGPYPHYFWMISPKLFFYICWIILVIWIR